jgi:hypothetical protein
MGVLTHHVSTSEGCSVPVKPLRLVPCYSADAKQSELPTASFNKPQTKPYYFAGHNIKRSKNREKKVEIFNTNPLVIEIKEKLKHFLVENNK